MNYSLITEQFLTVRFIDGHQDVLNLSDTLKQAHLIKKLEYPYPVKTEMYAMYRFLTQLVTDIYRPSDEEEIYEIYEKGYFDKEKIDAYFKEYKNRFDLFDDSYPFMQTSPKHFEKLDKAAKEMNTMSPLLRQGNNDKFYNPEHQMKEEMKWTLEHTICNLLFNTMNHVKTGSGYKAPIIGESGTTPLYILYEANNLFSTIIIGMDPVKGDEDIPYWRRDGYGEVYKRFTPMNYEFYPVMKIYLNKDEYINGNFGQIYIEPDNKHPIFKLGNEELRQVKQSIQLLHPGTIKRTNKKGEQEVEKADTRMELWLSMGVLLKSRGMNDIVRKKPVVSIMKEEGTLPKKINITFFGVYKGSKGTSFFRNIHESIYDIPTEMIFDESRQREIETIIEYIEKVGYILGIESIEYAKKALGSRQDKVPKEYQDIKTLFYRNMRNMFFTEYIRDSELDTISFIKKINKTCIRMFRSLSTIREDEITKKAYERWLIDKLVKEQAYGRAEKK